MKTVNMWLCRDDDGWRVLCPLAHPKPKRNRGEWEQVDRSGRERGECIGPSQFKVLFPHLKLKPGDDPRRVEITAKFVD